MPLTSNASGQAYALTVLTPIAPGEEDALRSYLEGLPRTPSPLARLPRTHFGRWVVVPDFVKLATQPKEDRLGCEYLLFTATFDGDLDSYLDELCGELAEEAERIWGTCIGCPAPAGGPGLKAYLRHNQIDTGLFFAAYPMATVQDVKGALATREQTIALAARGQGMSAPDLQQAFLETFGA
jgi:hypothetical protein